jgi:kindlin 2
MADSGYDAEVKSIQAFLSMQHPASQPVINPNSLDINLDEYVAPKFLRKMKSRKTCGGCLPEKSVNVNIAYQHASYYGKKIIKLIKIIT